MASAFSFTTCHRRTPIKALMGIKATNIPQEPGPRD